MNFYRDYSTANISAGKFHIPPEGILTGHPVEFNEFILPCKAFRIAVGLGDYRNEDSRFQLDPEALVDIMDLQQSIVRIFIKIDSDILFEGSFHLFSEVIDELSHPAVVLVVLLAVADEYIVFVAGNNTCHNG